MSTYIPHVEDSDKMTDIHSRMCGLVERMIPMNMHDSNWLCDGVIPFQDEAYECGRKRGAKEAAQPWRSLTDSEWVNVVNAPKVLDATDKDEAVAEAFKLIEAKLRELNEFRATPSPTAD